MSSSFLGSFEKQLMLASETGFESRAMNMETREHLKIIIGSRSPSGLPSIVEVPPMLEPPSPLPELDSQAADFQSQTRSELETARGELQALDHLLELEEAKVAEFEGSSFVDRTQSVDFIKLARQEVESEYERLSNFFKRKQNMSNSRSNTFDSGIADMSVAGSPVLRSLQSPRIGSPNSLRATQKRPFAARRRSSSISSNKALKLPIEGQVRGNIYTSSGTIRSDEETQNSRAVLHPPKRSASIDSLVKTKERYLEQFEKELAEIDQGDQLQPRILGDPAIPISPGPAPRESHSASELDDGGPLDIGVAERSDIEDGITKTRVELYDLLNKSFPPSPVIIQSSQFPPSTTAQSPVASSPPIPGQGLMHHRASFPQSVRSSATEREPWEWFAENVNVKGVQWSCARCSTVCPTAMQFKYGSTGALRLRVVCASSRSVLFNQDLSSSTPPLPRIFHSRADSNAITCVVVKGTNKRLEFSNHGNMCSLQLQVQPQYRFESVRDSELFQEVVFRMKLDRKFDIRAVSTNLDSGPTYTETLRIWQDVSSPEKLVLMTHGFLVKGIEPFIFWETRSAFASSEKVRETKLKLIMAEQRSMSRRHSRDSGVSGLSWSSRESQSSSQRMKWLEIDFQTAGERGEFLQVWTGQ